MGRTKGGGVALCAYCCRTLLYDPTLPLLLRPRGSAGSGVGFGDTRPGPAARPAASRAGPKAARPAAEPAPPNTRRCRYQRLAIGRDTTSFTLRDTLTIVPASVTANGQAVGYDPRTDRYQLVRPAPRDSSGVGRPDSVLLCYRVLPLPLLRARYRRPRRLMDSIDFRDRPMLGAQDFSQKEQILSTPGISKTGNLSRGFLLAIPRTCL
ncbi:hypothetical protein [Hymenobacter sp. BRD67]|uniref:hypothetical protein n=1 Tax=Hymenobacter sp. BRD67 TaxID=2675877 RepID=UPI001562F1FD|nr:hypothetical protein [Hymenobacter sp. BRD67]QKG53488.1 hypothetical protein GKZ67_13890 [Hymenobacter sp. BRD67]